jgi:DNA polymerase-3 subunit alpha
MKTGWPFKVRKHEVKIVATNNTFYIDKGNANAHDILCARRWKTNTTPIGRGRGYRYGLPNQEYYFKTGGDEKLFTDLPEAIWNFKWKCWKYLTRQILFTWL